MADRVKLRSPYGPAVIDVAADLAERYTSAGWVEAEKPKRASRATKAKAAEAADVTDDDES